jgi:ankyrin repeat protein
MGRSVLSGASPKAKGRDGRPAIQAAGDLEIITLLLDAGAGVDDRDDEGTAPFTTLVLAHDRSQSGVTITSPPAIR